MAVDRNPDVMEMVEDQLRENPDISNKDLKLKAEEIDEDIADLSARQFNARYPLQVKRKLSAEEKEDGAGDSGSAAGATAEAASGEGQSDGGGDEDVRDRIMSLVRRLLGQDEEISTREMQERAAEIDPIVKDLSTRQFHARFPLQVKRKLSSGGGTKSSSDDDGGAAEEERRQRVRSALLDFAKAVAGAEDRGEVIDVLTSVDEYVDRALDED